MFVFLRGKEAGVRPLHSDISKKFLLEFTGPIGSSCCLAQNGILYKRWEAPSLKKSLFQIVVPRNRVKDILREAHDSSSGGYFGINRTLGKIRKRFYCHVNKMLRNVWMVWNVCISKKDPTGKGKSPLQIYNVASFERVSSALFLFPYRGINIWLSLWIVSPNRWKLFLWETLEPVTKSFVNEDISSHGVPLEMHTDQGRNFESKLFSELMSLLRIKKTRTTTLHPQSDGQVERQYQTIVNYLAKFVSIKPTRLGSMDPHVPFSI